MNHGHIYKLFEADSNNRYIKVLCFQRNIYTEEEKQQLLIHLPQFCGTYRKSKIFSKRLVNVAQSIFQQKTTPNLQKTIALWQETLKSVIMWKTNLWTDFES